jgi:hypothetical protein
MPEVSDEMDVPLLEPFPAVMMLAIVFPYKTSQREPLGTVTVCPVATDIGPTDMALEPDGML